MAEDWWPTPADVKAHIPTRLGGRPFDAATRPTEGQVQTWIGALAVEVAGVAGGALVQPTHRDLGKLVTSIGVAALVERSINPEQATEADSAYSRLMAEYERMLKSIKGVAVGAQPGSGSQVTGVPSHTFPEPVVGSIHPERYVPFEWDRF